MRDLVEEFVAAGVEPLQEGATVPKRKKEVSSEGLVTLALKFNCACYEALRPLGGLVWKMRRRKFVAPSLQLRVIEFLRPSKVARKRGAIEFSTSSSFLMNIMRIGMHRRKVNKLAMKQR